MKCPFCGYIEDKVIDSRTTKENDTIRRRRQCLKCDKKFTTYEQIAEFQIKVIKKDGRRESFDRNKIKNGLIKSCEKRPISIDIIEGIINEIEQSLQNIVNKEVSSSFIGEKIMEKLHSLDEVAYVRFASVYRQFKDLDEFIKEVKQLLSKNNGGNLKNG